LINRELRPFGASRNLKKETQMAIVYRNSDRVRIKIDDIEVLIKPLTYREKSEISQLMVDGKIGKAAVEAVKCAVKDVKGIKQLDGKKYELEFDNDKLSENTIDDLMNLSHSKKLILVCLNLLSTIPEKFVDETTGEELEGVSIVKEKKTRKK
jgi:hypothetical protein